MLKRLFGRKPEPQLFTVLCATSRGPEYLVLDDEAKRLIQETGQYITKSGIIVAYFNEMHEQEIGYLSGERFKTWLKHPPSERRDRLRFVRHCMLQDS